MNEREFRDFFHLMHPKLVQYAARRIDAETANEVAIDTLRTIWTKGCSYPRSDSKERQLFALCYRVCDGLISNAARSSTRRTALVAAVAGGAAHRSTTPDIADDVVDRLDCLHSIPGLTEPERRLLGLLVDGYRVAEIAMILGISPAAAGMRVTRAKKILKRHIEETGREVAA
jgi:RNA polymerase sigma-70 factor (ECF subfamily)